MKHVIVCTEYPPAPIPPGGIGTYVRHIALLLAEAGETVHVIGPLWEGAPKKVEEFCGGRLIIHRVPPEDSQPGIGNDLARTAYPPQSFSWQASLLTEVLINKEGIDLIETQDYRAPLYYFQLRRALGLGPRRLPPCILHLHSPTEFIVRHNEYDLGNPYFLTAKRHEDYSIGAADVLLCPSRYLARQIETSYGVKCGSISVIPYPIGDTPVIVRSEEVWRSGTICYLGRLEPRKGVVEYVEAAVAVADENPFAQFEFIGADQPYTHLISVQRFVENRIPHRLKSRFHFRGSRPRLELFEFLRQARMTVVPSRWENFPNTCVEAMCSGLPVIASPEGGMAEMIRDGETGWLADNAKSDGLAEALRRALATPPVRLADMGRSASIEIRQICDNKKTVENQLHFRRKIVAQGSKRSIRLPMNLPWVGRPLSDDSARRRVDHRSAKGLAFVVDCAGVGRDLEDCIQSLEQQTRAPATVVLVANHACHDGVLPALQRAGSLGCKVCELPGGSSLKAKNIAVEEVFAAGVDPTAFVFLDAADRLEPHFAETCESVFQHCPEVGLVSSWTKCAGDNNGLVANPCPAFPYQWLFDDTVHAVTVRTEALREVGLFHDGLHSGFDHWDLVNSVMAAGWVAVTVPEVLGERMMTSDISTPTVGYSRMRREILARFPDLIARDSQELVHLLESHIIQIKLSTSPDWGQSWAKVGIRNLRPKDILRLTIPQAVALAQKAFRNPNDALKFLLWRTHLSVEKLGSRFLKTFIYRS